MGILRQTSCECDLRDDYLFVGLDEGEQYEGMERLME